MFTFSAPDSQSKKVTLLNEIEELFPWDSITRRIDHSFSKKHTGRKRIPTIIMIKMMILQYIFGLSDESAQEDIFDRKSFYNFIGEDLLDTRGVPDATTLCKFRKHLTEKKLDRVIFNTILNKLEKQGAFLKQGTVVDSTIIHAPSSTNNKSKKCDPAMANTKKGSNYHFGMKAHQGTDADTGIVHTIICTPANESDMNHCEDLLHGEEIYVGGDKGYASKERKQFFREQGMYYGILDKAPQREITVSLSKEKKQKETIYQSKSRASLSSI